MQVDDLVHDSDSEKNFTIEDSPLVSFFCQYNLYNILKTKLIK